jgi:hypothetical protein
MQVVNVIVMGLCLFFLPSPSTLALAQTGENPLMSDFRETAFTQHDLLRSSPDDAAPFVPLLMPEGQDQPPISEERLSRQGDWEEVRLRYFFKYNGSADPEVCALSLFEETVSGFRRIVDKP